MGKLGCGPELNNIFSCCSRIADLFQSAQNLLGRNARRIHTDLSSHGFLDFLLMDQRSLHLLNSQLFHHMKLFLQSLSDGGSKFLNIFIFIE